MTADIFVSVVATVHDPGALLEPFVAETLAALAATAGHWELIVVDDGSRGTPRSVWDALLARHDNVRVLHLSREVGEERAIAAGLDAAIGDFVVTMSPGADPPALIPALVQRGREGADVVLGARRTRGGDPWWLRAGASLFYWYARRVMRLELPANATHFRCLSREALNALNTLRETGTRLHVFTTYFGYTSTAFPYDLIGQTRRSRSATPGAAVSLAIGMVLDNSARPMRVASLLCLLLALLNVIYAGSLLVAPSLAEVAMSPASTQTVLNAAQFAFLSLVVAVLCEYVGRLPGRLGGDPAYVVAEERASAVSLGADRPNVVREP